MPLMESNNETVKEIDRLLTIQEIKNDKIDLSIKVHNLCEDSMSCGPEYVIECSLTKMSEDHAISEHDKNTAKNICNIFRLCEISVDNLFEINQYIGLFSLRALILYENNLSTASSDYIVEYYNAVSSLLFQMRSL